MSNEVMFTRIRLARNLKKYPFPSRLNSVGKDEVCKVIIEAVNDCGALINEPEILYLKDLSEAQRAALVEQHLASPEFISDSAGRAVVLSKGREIGILINGEDHLRIQILKKGFDLKGAYELADRLDTLLDGKLNFAFSEKLGYLTQCPTNLGTGMRASVTLHLPALRRNNAIGRIAGNLSKLGLTIRGTYGDSTDSKAAMYRLSNQVTLGISENAAIENLGNIANQLISREQSAAERLSESIDVQDKVFRSLGILRTARLISGDEAMEMLSNVRFGINAGIIDEIGLDKVDNLIADIQPATMAVNKNVSLGSGETDILRAEILRSI